VVREFETEFDEYESLFDSGVSIEKLIPVLVKSNVREVKRFLGWLRYWSRLETVSAELVGALSMFEGVVEFVEKKECRCSSEAPATEVLCCPESPVTEVSCSSEASVTETQSYPESSVTDNE
jgi:hypothetical protein